MEATHDYGVLTDLPLLDDPIPAQVIEHDPILSGCEIFVPSRWPTRPT